MKKRILAFVMVLAMVLSLLPLGVVAEEQTVPEAHTDAHDCTACDGAVTWTAWDKKNEFPTTPGHYYLTVNVDLTGWRTIGSGEYTVCLNGHYIKGEPGKSFATVGDGTVLTISDCTAYYDADGKYISGYVSGSQTGNGGCFYVSRGGTLNLESGAIKDSSSTSSSKLGGGAVYLQGSNATKKAVFNMTGGEISNCSAAKNGGAVYVSNGVESPVSEFNMSGGRIHNNTAPKSGAVHCVTAKVTISGDAIIENHTVTGDMGAIGIYDGVLEMSGGIIRNNQAANGAGVLVQSGGSMVLSGGEISGNTATGAGGGIYISTGCEFTMSGGTISGNTAPSGGGIYHNGSIATHSGGIISNNTATNTGGGIGAAGGAKLTLSGVTISGNSALKAGGVYGSTNTEIVLSGGGIINNTASSVGGGLYVNNKNKSLTVQGAPVITGNAVGGMNSNLHLEGTRIITLGELTEGAKILVTADGDSRAISTASDTDYSAYFDGDSAARQVGYREDKMLWLEVATNHKHCLCAAAAQGCDHEKQTWTPWENGTALPSTSGYYFLTTDVKLELALELAGDTDIKLCLNGHTVTANGPEGKSGDRIVGLSENAKFTVTDCTAAVDADGNYTAGRLTGGSLSGILFRKQATDVIFNMYGGILTGNKAAGAGGAVTVQGVGRFNLYGGEISGNEAVENGGAFYVDGGFINVFGGKIVNNTAGGIGGGIYAKGEAVITLAGGEISGNSAAQAGGVYVGGKCQMVSVEGAPVITGNTAAGAVSNLYLSGDRIMTLGTLTEGAKVGVSAEGSPRAVSKVTAQDVSGFFEADDANQTVQYREDSMLWLDTYTGHVHCLCAANVKSCDHTDVKWYPWESTTSLPSSGNYYLTGDVTLKTALELAGNKDLKLCLNGHNITIDGPEGKSADRIFGLSENAKLTITDCTAKTVDGKYTAGKMTGGSLSGVIFRKQATGVVFNMYGGIFTENKAAAAGGAISVQGVSVFNMYGGEVSGNEAAEHGGAFYVDGAALNIYGGKITGNKAGTNGGGIYSKNSAKITIAGGEISGNTATGDGGGGIAAAASTSLMISGGKVSGNTANSGAGFILTGGSKLTMTGGEVSGNTAKLNGGAGYVSKNTAVTMKGGSVSGNYTNESGAAFYLSYAEITLSGGSISGNTAKKAGAAVYLSKSTATLSGTYIGGNKAQNAAGIMVSTNSHLTMTGGTIADGTVEDRGAGVYHNKSTGTYTGGTISGNKAGIEGAGIYATGSTLKLSGVRVKNNQSPNSGGVGLSTKCDVTMTAGEISGNSGENGAGVLIASKSNFKMSGGKISSNTVTNSGGGIYLSKNAFMTITGGEISGNTACGYGGGIYTYSPCEIGGVLIANNQVVGCTEHPNPRGGGVFIGSQTNKAYIHDCQFIGNHSFKDGGGLYGQNQNFITVENVTFENNIADNKGGGMYINLGCYSTMRDITLIGNSSTSTGSGMWAADDLSIHNLVATGNTSTGTGGAVYITTASYDGESYVTNLVKISGLVQVYDNVGNAPDFVLSEGAFATIGSEGLAEGSRINVILRAGLLTQTLFGNYDYEGGNLLYTVTPGTRSATDPEKLPGSAEPEQTEPTEEPTTGTTTPIGGADGPTGILVSGSSIVLWIAIAVVVAAAAVIIPIAIKKKKN